MNTETTAVITEELIEQHSRNPSEEIAAIYNRIQKANAIEDRRFSNRTIRLFLRFVNWLLAFKTVAARMFFNKECGRFRMTENSYTPVWIEFAGTPSYLFRVLTSKRYRSGKPNTKRFKFELTNVQDGNLVQWSLSAFGMEPDEVVPTRLRIQLIDTKNPRNNVNS